MLCDKRCEFLLRNAETVIQRIEHGNVPVRFYVINDIGAVKIGKENAGTPGNVLFFQKHPEGVLKGEKIGSPDF